MTSYDRINVNNELEGTGREAAGTSLNSLGETEESTYNLPSE
jgi:hypothetical protein